MYFSILCTCSKDEVFAFTAALLVYIWLELYVFVFILHTIKYSQKN